MSTLKIYNNKEKKKVLNYLMRFFMFIFLVWTLQCYNNWASFRPWNCENELKNISNLGIKRSLAENKNAIMQVEGSKCYEQHSNVEIDLESLNEQNYIKRDIDSEQENELEIIDKNQKVKFNQRILGICKSNFEIIPLSIAFFLSFIALICSLVYIFKSDINEDLKIFELSNTSILITSILLTHKEIKIKRKNKFK
ncbi:fam-h protein [Plasmodium relictum]|uniref:Fam-h protein n=1 Tax=Plasmodium relictum TaxID=85471 RepID=A0A1J1GMM0_PLARL|nr:fam-h protein [Plasmodium relictum]CRG84053.1 fam-h protein [Plasmodium relictum]